MKRVLTILVVALVAVASAIARDRVTTEVAELPEPAKVLLSKYFPKTPVNHVKIESHTFGGDDYDVVLSDGTEIDFDSKGSLKEIDCGRSEVPAGIVLKSIRDYVGKSFNGKKIVSMEVKRNKYEIELSDGTDLEFDRAGNFRKIDL